MTDKKKVESLDGEELEQIKGGAGKGSQLLGHELTHVTQQRESGVDSIAGKKLDGVTKLMTGGANKGEI